MNFLNFFFIREIISPFLVGVLCFTLGTHRAPAVPDGVQDLAMINGCVVSACNYMAVVKAKHTLDRDFWAKVLLVRYAENSAGHAYCVWETDGTIYGYDRNSGGFPIPRYTHDPKEIASILAVELSKHLDRTLTVASADFVEPSKTQLTPF
ncbi:MAG: hypothetical protein H0T11_03635 [Chthoniobacterales bacterium]|nr:hypothetical protein [Chthoniobacterales bacterium]